MKKVCKKKKPDRLFNLNAFIQESNTTASGWRMWNVFEAIWFNHRFINKIACRSSCFISKVYFSNPIIFYTWNLLKRKNQMNRTDSDHCESFKSNACPILKKKICSILSMLGHGIKLSMKIKTFINKRLTVNEWMNERISRSHGCCAFAFT